MTMKVRKGYLRNRMRWWSSTQETVDLLQRVLERKKTHQSKGAMTLSPW
jgi:hypothetical protein